MCDNTSPSPLVTVITVVYNNVSQIHGAMRSVLSQKYQPVEYIIIDGGSTDGTVDLIQQLSSKISLFLSESDGGIYDALNKGIKLSSGKYIAILHSDDLFQDDLVVGDMVDTIVKDKSEVLFSNMVIVDKTTSSVSRFYYSNIFSPWLLRSGWMPPHPACLIDKTLFDEFGLYDAQYIIAADYDFLLRIFFRREIRWTHLNRVTVRMRQGGVSNSGLRSKLQISLEIKKSLKKNGVWSLPIFQFVRYIIRLSEFIIRPN